MILEDLKIPTSPSKTVFEDAANSLAGHRLTSNRSSSTIMFVIAVSC